MLSLLKVENFPQKELIISKYDDVHCSQLSHILFSGFWCQVDIFWQSQDLKAFSIVPTLNIPTIYMSKLYKPLIHMGEHLTRTIARVILVQKTSPMNVYVPNTPCVSSFCAVSRVNPTLLIFWPCNHEHCLVPQPSFWNQTTINRTTQIGWPQHFCHLLNMVAKKSLYGHHGPSFLPKKMKSYNNFSQHK